MDIKSLKKSSLPAVVAVADGSVVVVAEGSAVGVVSGVVVLAEGSEEIKNVYFKSREISYYNQPGWLLLDKTPSRSISLGGKI